MFEKLMKYFKLHLYTKEMLHAFVDKGVITEEQYKIIVGEE